MKKVTNSALNHESLLVTFWVSNRIIRKSHHFPEKVQHSVENGIKSCCYTCKKIQFSFLTSQKNRISDDIHTFSFHTFHCKFNLKLVCTSFTNLHFAISSKIQHCATRSELVGPRAQGWQRVNKEGGGYHAIIILARKKPGLPTHPTFANLPYFKVKNITCQKKIRALT